MKNDEVKKILSQSRTPISVKQLATELRGNYGSSYSTLESLRKRGEIVKGKDVKSGRVGYVLRKDRKREGFEEIEDSNEQEEESEKDE
jgi:predicted DNA-binding transcriptional regulator